ncbi:MAG TPA: SHOCT domain-containing protein [Solirubrobacteraceae bacterium]|nr:SHOCT domain-containing protein [Solirubrobacteraceae bacterium]
MSGRRGVGGFFSIAGVVLTVVGLGLLSGSLVTGLGAGGAIAGGTLLMIGVIWAAVGLGLGAFYGRMKAKMEDEQRLFETGERATAVIEAVETTGMVVNDVNAQTRVTVRVKPRHGDEYTVTRSLLVPFSAMPRTGDLIEVAYDPADRETLAFETDWRMDTAGGRALVTRRPEAEASAPAPSPTVAAGAPPAATDLLGKLELLQRLREDGALTDEEFEAQKARLLAGG